MAVSYTTLITGRYAEATDTGQYTTGTVIVAVIDSFTAVNTSSTDTATLNINIVQSGDTASNSNLVMIKELLPLESYECSEAIGHYLIPGAFISTKASVGSTIAIRASGREIS